MTANINPESGIAYGYVSANALDPEVVHELQFGSQATEPAYEGQLAFELDVIHEKLKQGIEIEDRWTNEEDGSFNEDAFTEEFSVNWQPDEPIHEGVIRVPGYLPLGDVKYRTSWLGGALNVWIFQSPCVTHKAGRASPCVPNAGILDTLDGDVTAYDVPADWRRE